MLIPKPFYSLRSSYNACRGGDTAGASAARSRYNSPMTDLLNFPEGVRNLSGTLIIPARRSTMGGGVPAPFLATAPSFPGGWLHGADEFGTVLRFAPTVTGALIQTEGYDSGTVGQFWNNNNRDGDTRLRANLCSSASDFTVDGQATLRAYPFAYGPSDVHGQGLPRRADGLCVQGSGFVGERLRFYQIPGTAIILGSGSGTQAGAYGIYDASFSRLSNIYVNLALNGIRVDAGDCQLNDINTNEIAFDALTINGPGTKLRTAHLDGADRALVANCGITASDLYCESARIGVHLAFSPGHDSSNSRITGLEIGPGTCWSRGVLIESNGCQVTGLTGTITTKFAPDAAGVEIKSVFSAMVQGSIYARGTRIAIGSRGRRTRWMFMARARLGLSSRCWKRSHVAVLMWSAAPWVEPCSIYPTLT